MKRYRVGLRLEFRECVGYMDVECSATDRGEAITSCVAFAVEQYPGVEVAYEDAVYLGPDLIAEIDTEVARRTVEVEEFPEVRTA